MQVFFAKKWKLKFYIKPLLSQQLVCFKAWTGRKQIFNSEWNCTGYKNTKTYNSCWKTIVKKSTKKIFFIFNTAHSSTCFYLWRALHKQFFFKSKFIHSDTRPSNASVRGKFMARISNISWKFSICMNSSGLWRHARNFSWSILTYFR